MLWISSPHTESKWWSALTVQLQFTMTTDGWHRAWQRIRQWNRIFALFSVAAYPALPALQVHPLATGTVREGVCFLQGLGVEQIDVGPVYGTVGWTDRQIKGLCTSLIETAQFVRDLRTSGHRLEVGPVYRDTEHVGGILSDRWGCHAASSHLAFLPTGQISGCSALAMLAEAFPHLIIGNAFAGLDQQSIDRGCCRLLKRRWNSDRAANAARPGMIAPEDALPSTMPQPDNHWCRRAFIAARLLRSHLPGERHGKVILAKAALWKPDRETPTMRWGHHATARMEGVSGARSHVPYPFASPEKKKMWVYAPLTIVSRAPSQEAIDPRYSANAVRHTGAACAPAAGRA